jgi:hypothetical protein
MIDDDILSDISIEAHYFLYLMVEKRAASLAGLSAFVPEIRNNQ